MATVEELKAAYDEALAEVASKHGDKADADEALKAARARCIAANEAIVAAETAANRKKTALGLAEGWAIDAATELTIAG